EDASRPRVTRWPATTPPRCLCWPPPAWREGGSPCPGSRGRVGTPTRRPCALAAMGIEIQGQAGAVTAAARRGGLQPVSVRATDFPDAVPALAALAAAAVGESRFEGVGHLRVKESDRIASLVSLLEDVGAGPRARAHS